MFSAKINLFYLSKFNRGNRRYSARSIVNQLEDFLPNENQQLNRSPLEMRPNPVFSVPVGKTDFSVKQKREPKTDLKSEVYQMEHPIQMVILNHRRSPSINLQFEG